MSGDGGGDEARSLGGVKGRVSSLDAVTQTRPRGEVKVPGKNGDSHNRLPGWGEDVMGTELD